MTDDRAPRRGRWQIVALAVMFFGPAIVAWLLVLSDWRPSGTTNNGTLIQPPVRVDAGGWELREGSALTRRWFTGHWTLLVANAGGCDGACAELLDTLRRVRIALDKDADRVTVLLLQPAGQRAPDVRYPGLIFGIAPAETVRALSGDADRRGLYIVDFQGFRMMTYDLPTDGSGVLNDMELLLKRANEDVERMQRLRKASGKSE